MEEAQYAVTPLPRFASLSPTRGSVPDETMILNFWRLLEQHDLAPKLFAAVSAYLTDKGMLLRQGIIVDATIIHVPPFTMKRDKARDSKVHQTKKGQQWCFVTNTHVAAGAESGLTHAVTTTVANVAEVDKMLHGKGKAMPATSVPASVRPSENAAGWWPRSTARSRRSRTSSCAIRPHRSNTSRRRSGLRSNTRSGS
jgi:transposase, IS5 family